MAEPGSISGRSWQLSFATGTPATRQLVQVIGYPVATSQPVTCQNRLREPMTDQLEFDCDGYTDGTSGGPFLSDVDQATGQGLVIGVIGGYQQGGDVPQVSYSAVLGANAAALYEQAVAGALVMSMAGRVPYLAELDGPGVPAGHVCRPPQPEPAPGTAR